ncbi:hypothetical protein U1Q18_002551, partial [Sarracenia purpurea var. burkii]
CNSDRAGEVQRCLEVQKFLVGLGGCAVLFVYVGSADSAVPFVNLVCLELALGLTCLMDS